MNGTSKALASDNGIKINLRHIPAIKMTLPIIQSVSRGIAQLIHHQFKLAGSVDKSYPKEKGIICE